MPTFCTLAGYEPPTDFRWDGRDLWPTIAGKTAPEPRSIYIAGPGFRSAAVHEGDWKLVVHRASGGQAQAKTELFHLSEDPYETQDLAAANPRKVAELEARLAELSAADRDSVAND
jgi:arylsulfatase A-like enzyme